MLLPNHLHYIWTLPKDDSDFSTEWRLIKTRFTRKCNDKFNPEAFESRKRKKEQTIWQRRFWEHQIPNEHDFQKHVEYIHYNPVHHKYAKFPKDWPYSSFHRYVREGKYDAAWGWGRKSILRIGVTANEFSVNVGFRPSTPPTELILHSRMVKF